MKSLLLAAFFLLASQPSIQANVNVNQDALSESQMRERIQELQNNIRIDDKTAISHQQTRREDTCWTVWGACPGGTYFDETRKMLPPFNSSVYIKREVLRRARNTQSSTNVDLRREKSTITVDTTTSGWSITADASTGSWNPMSGASKGLSISGGYSSSTTTGQTLTVSDSSTFSCPPRHKCWSEGWTAYVRIMGKCQLVPKVTCWNTYDNMCASKDSGDKWDLCANVQEYLDRPTTCNGLEGVVQDCVVETPIMDGKRPFLEEVFFEEPIKSLEPKPQITGYQSGYYILNDDPDTRYFPMRDEDKFWTPSKKFHADERWPNLDDQVANFKHEKPKLMSPEPNDDCYVLDTREYICVRRTSKKYWSLAVNDYYDKPGAPEPDLSGAKEPWPLDEHQSEGKMNSTEPGNEDSS
ncbi:hypothetical protein XA68_15968 [Ophiocordyceps unilateralis]|uniref:Uncharacterized protein n=1 Tax=Ophiocordyceps unilateralis TaxID=268505 RepID=A0A2A9P7J1_OPHUN|nr:hypothetical protein XA68_15968 [Ophiocordyceps unilateralis]